MEFRVAQVQPDDEKELVDLLQLVFNGWPKFDLHCTPLEHWRWKFLENVHSRNFNVKALSNGKIVGCFHGFELNVKIGDNIHKVSSGVDLAVHPDYRRMGMYKEMLEYRIKLRLSQGILMTLWSSGNPIILDYQRKRYAERISFPRQLIILVRIRDLDLFFQKNPSLNKMKIRIGYPISSAVNRFFNLFKGPIRSDSEIRISQIERFDDKINIFWKDVADEYSFIVERDKDFLNWRYCDPRAGEYIVYLAEDDNRILGYCVLRINKYNSEYHMGYIVDLLALNDQKDVIDRLVLESISYFDLKKVNMVQCLCTKNSKLETTLRGCGFIDSRIKKYVAVSQRGLSPEKMRKIPQDIIKKKLHLVYSDFDDI